MSELKIDEIAAAIYDLSKSMRLLGNGNIDRPDVETLGAIEGLTVQIKESNEKTAAALGDIAEAIRDLAQAVEKTKDP